MRGRPSWGTSRDLPRAPSDPAAPAPGAARHAFPGRPWLAERTDRARAVTASRGPERQQPSQVALSRQPDSAHTMGQLVLERVASQALLLARWTTRPRQ